MAQDPGNPRRVVIVGPSALRDLSTIYDYTAQQWSDGQAEAYADFLDQIMRDLAENPAAAPIVPGLNRVRVRIAHWKKGRQGHRIFFEAIPEGIYVLRILHTSMNWQEHLEYSE